MPLLLLILFVVLPIAELYVIIKVGQEIGVLWTLALLVADSVLGTVLMRSQGRTAWRRFNEAISAGRVPAKEAADGALVILGGAFLLAPGFLTDILGVLLLLPPSRAVIRRAAVRGALGRIFVAMPGGAPRGGPRRPPSPPGDVDSTAHDIDSDPRRLP